MSNRIVDAISDRDHNALRAALAAGDSPDGDGTTYIPLHAAAIYQNGEAIEPLLKAGALVDHTEAKNMTALHFACLGQLAPRYIQQLLDAGANVNALGPLGTPLDCADRAGERGKQLTTVLRRAGAEHSRQYLAAKARERGSDGPLRS